MRRTRLTHFARSVAAALASFLFALAASVGAGIQPAAAQSSNFTTPSGNIDCLIFELDGGTSASCVVKSAAWKRLPKKPADCDLDWSPTEIGVSDEPSAGGKRTISIFVGACRGDIGPTCPPDSCPVLSYGKSRTIASVTCTSRTTGMTCLTNGKKKQGFMVSRSGYKVIR